MEAKVIASVSLTVPCGGVVGVFIFVSLKVAIGLTLLLPVFSWQSTVSKLVALGQSVTDVFKLVLNTLSKSISQIKELFMINSLAVKAFVWCVAASLWRLGSKCFPTRKTA